MPEENNVWHLDKRVSVGHIVSTITITIAVMVWMFKLENRVAVNEIKIAQNTLVAMQHKSELSAQAEKQYSEIIRRLERIDNRLIGDAETK